MGVRRYQVLDLYTGLDPKGPIKSRFLSLQCGAILERANAQADAGSFQLQQRPDLQLGRTFINPLRWKSSLITGISNTWSPGGAHTTTLTCTYGHPVHKTLESPWAAVQAEPKLFFGEGNLEKFSPLGPDGKPLGTTGDIEPNTTVCSAAEDVKKK